MRSFPTAAYISDHDETSSAVYCKPADTLGTTPRDAYWLTKAFQWIEAHPFPIP